MRAALTALAVAGCSFQLPEATPGGDGAGPQSRRCTSLGAVDPSELRLCLELEDASPMAVARDTSGLDHDALAVLVTPTPHGTEQAGAFGDGSRLTVNLTSDLDITPAVTIDLFAAVALPIASGDRYWMLDHGDHYFISYGDDHEVRCGIEHDHTVDSGSSARIADAQFHHVACSYDGRELRVYVDGDLARCQTPDATIDATPALTDIGHEVASISSSAQFRGALDDIHVFARALRPDEICALARRGSGCTATCPSSE